MDIAMAVVFLSSDAGSFISGDTFVVDGAERLWTPPPIPYNDVKAMGQRRQSKSNL